MPSRVYTKEEADAILARAIEMQRGDSTSHDDLVAAASEVGVPREAIERAAREVLSRRRDEDDVRALRARSWRMFLAHLVPYVMVNALLAFINVLTGSFPWVIIVMLAWGVGLGSHLLTVVMPDREKLLRRVERQRERARRRGIALERAGLGAAVGAGGARVAEELRVSDDAAGRAAAREAEGAREADDADADADANDREASARRHAR